MSDIPPLRLPGDAGLMANIKLSQTLHLRAQPIPLSLFPGEPTPTWCFTRENSINPILHIRRGETFDVVFHNDLAEDSTIHWHGLAVDESNDGSGLHPVAPGTQRRYRFAVQQRAGLYLYHAHPHGRTGAQIQQGLAGLLIVEDEESLALRTRLNLPWGARDLPLVFADKQIDERNAIVYKDGADDWIGNRMLVNWTPEPFLDVVAGWYRFRLANIANARVLRLAFMEGQKILPMQLIGTDGGLLSRAWPMDDLFLGPAQRADVLVDFSSVATGSHVIVRSLGYVAMENEGVGDQLLHDPIADHPGAAPMGAPLDMMVLRVGSRDTASRPHLGFIARLEPPPDISGWPLRQFRLRLDDDGTWFINDWNFHLNGHHTAFSVKRGTREVWEIRNSMSSMPHPMHVHGFQFRVISRSISPTDVRGRQVAAGGLTPQDLGWNDTVLIWPGEIVRIAIDFSQRFQGEQRYMFHCHNLEHEDRGMMLTFAVTD